MTPLAITMGDPGGIGPEIIVKAVLRRRGAHRRPLLVLGDPDVIQAATRTSEETARIRLLEDPADAVAGEGVMNVLRTSSFGVPAEMGTVNRDNGQAAFDAISAAVRLASAGKVAGVVTAPINKEAFAAANIRYPGHTELLADQTNADRVAMMLANDEIRTVLVTIHCSLREAIEQADFEAQMAAIRLADEGCRVLGVERPRVAVAGLNPHAGEGGLFGREEIDIIGPAIEAARDEGINASGPWSGDTVFMQARRGAFDVVVAQYHDQGLIPVKYLGLEKGVNITLGLPFVRTSPDHGTAFDIAGKGIADPSSLETAIVYAERMADVATTRRPAQTPSEDVA